MTQTRELSPLVLPHDLPDLKLGADNIYTVTFSVHFGFMAGFLDTPLGKTVLRIASAVVAAVGFVMSLVVIMLAPLFPWLVSTAPPQVPYPPSATSPSSPHRRRRAYVPPVSITVSVRRDPSIVPIIERSERDSASPSPALPVRRVSFSPQSSSTSVPTTGIPNNNTLDPPSRPGSSNGHPTLAIRRVREEQAEVGAYILPTPPASIASISSEGDEVGMEEFGMVSPGVGKRGRRSFLLFSPKRSASVKGKEKQTVEDGESMTTRQRAHSIALSALEGASKRSSWISHASRDDDTLRESETETDRGSRASTTEKGDKRRSGLSFQDFRAAFGKRERRASVLVSTSGSNALSPSEGHSPPRSLGLGTPSSVPSHPSPRSASDELARRKHTSSPPLRLDTVNSPTDTERREVQSPISDAAAARPLFGGEVVIRNESGRRRTRSSAIPGLYADAQVVRRW
ncbi:hypothetical protein RSOLAG22IIIB_06231 [Rhizoctonia solani]|uniref:Uncharacterized protein n=1 Tax=Rhizoctonia solani TaxID=456999 RepID=A0A0K6GD95_9AGAM|nr:hypothetical protein RSOLAG22IIIB_06231 [Rhizoctonia solani]